jgi:UPF0755 protein
VLSVALVYLSFYLPQQTAAKFGPPTMDLPWWERLYYSVLLLSNEQDLTTSTHAYTDSVKVNIAYGETAFSVAQRLSDLNLIHNVNSFEHYLVYSGLDRSIQAGDYIIEPDLNPIEIAQKLQDATPSEIVFAVLAGWRLEEIAEGFPTSGFSITPDDFLSFSRNPTSTLTGSLNEWSGSSSLEGIFLPGEYIFPRNITVDQLITFFIDQFETQVQQELEDGFHTQGLTLREGVILASVVQREAVLTDEQPLIASVFINRLTLGMRLESDPTVQYALGYSPQTGSWWKNPLSLEDLNVQSPYNTYLYPGLPPGPICNPGISALRAVAYPAQTSYLYFRAKCDGTGEHNFANSYEEHLSNACVE